GSLVLERPGTYAFVFTGRTGREVARGPEMPLAVEPDLPPSASLLFPAPELEVDPDQEVLLRWEASDDYGLTGVALAWTGPDGQQHRKPLAQDDGRTSCCPLKCAVGPLHLAAGGRVGSPRQPTINHPSDGPLKRASRH